MKKNIFFSEVSNFFLVRNFWVVIIWKTIEPIFHVMRDDDFVNT